MCCDSFTMHCASALSATLWRSSQECTWMGMLTIPIKNNAEFVVSQHIMNAQLSEGSGEGIPPMLGDKDVPPFWPSFLTLWGLNIRITNPYIIRSFWPKIPFLPRSLLVRFSVASSTLPSIFRPKNWFENIGTTKLNIWPRPKYVNMSCNH